MSDALELFTIYERPSDFPRWFVVRRWQVGAAWTFADPWLYAVGSNLMQVRAKIPPGLTRMVFDRDAPCVVETWL